MLRKVERTDPILDGPIERVLQEMEVYGPDSPEYPELLTRLEKLLELKAKNQPPRVTPDQMAMVLGNIAGILIIVSYEHAHVVVSKALGLLVKPK